MLNSDNALYLNININTHNQHTISNHRLIHPITLPFITFCIHRTAYDVTKILGIPYVNTTTAYDIINQSLPHDTVRTRMSPGRTDYPTTSCQYTLFLRIFSTYTFSSHSLYEPLYQHQMDDILAQLRWINSPVNHYGVLGHGITWHLAVYPHNYFCKPFVLIKQRREELKLVLGDEQQLSFFIKFLEKVGYFLKQILIITWVVPVEAFQQSIHTK